MYKVGEREKREKGREIKREREREIYREKEYEITDRGREKVCELDKNK